MSDEYKMSLQSISKETNYSFDSNPFDFEPSQTCTNEDKTLEGVSNMSSLFYPDTNLLGRETPRAKAQPDEDSMKMFVGQVPPHFNETDLLQMFESFGKVYELKILRDRLTGRSKGCCFVTFFTKNAALNAQNALHNTKTLPGMHHPIQMKPADTENRSDRKLFIGMISKTFSESDIRSLFSPFGPIEECTVLRDVTKQSKGCAFLTYSSRQSAQNAVKTMHHSHVFEGCSSPIVVKFADTQKDKQLRRLQVLGSELNNQHQLTQILQKLSIEPLPSLLSQPNTGNILQHLQYAGHLSPNSQISVIKNVLPTVQTPFLQTLMTVPPVSLQNINTAGGLVINPFAAQSVSSLTVNDELILNKFLGQVSANNGPVGMTVLPQGHPESPYHSSTPTLDLIVRRQPWEGYMVSPKQIEGPEGANLFIYHLPLEFTDQKLAELFQPFGRVISAKVFIDKITRLSKCFGFVSYDNVLSAKVAIQNLNGYNVFGKKLKVEIKKKKHSQE